MCFFCCKNLDLNETLAGEWLKEVAYPWQVLGDIKEIILELQKGLGNEFLEVSPQVFIHKTARVAESAVILPPAIIGAETEVRPSAYIRGSVLVGENCVIGNSTEVKNSILFNKACVPHFNYVGDSILGYCAHLGAGAICSNVKSDKTPVVVRGHQQEYKTNLKKFGAIVGDNTEVGCNAVLNPGTILGRNVTVYPLTFVRGVVESGTIVKTNGIKVLKRGLV